MREGVACIFAPIVTKWYGMLEGIKMASKPASTYPLIHWMMD